MMKPGIDRKGGSPPTSALARAPGMDIPSRPLRSLPPGGLVSLSGRPFPTDRQRQVAIQAAHRYGAPSPRVFDAWLDPDVARRWLFATASHPIADLDIDARIGGSFRFVDRRFGEVIEHTGEYIEIVPYQRLAFTLSLAQRPQVSTRVAVEIAPRKNGCLLKLTHEDVPQEHASQVEGRWTGILYGLGATLDSLSTKVHHHEE